MSLRMVSNDSAELFTMVSCSRCSSFSEVSSTSSVIPMTPFIGVRISWLMAARKLLLAWLACSAADLAACNSASKCLRSVMSLAKPSKKRGFPVGSERIDISRFTQIMRAARVM